MIDEFLGRTFNVRTYNCWDLVREFWLRLTGEVLDSVSMLGSNEQRAEEGKQRYREIEKPRSPCIVLMLRPRHTPHVGVYYGDRVLHIQRHGVQYTSLLVATQGFPEVRFYLPCRQ